MKISIIHPSRNRPKQALETINNWLSKSDNPKQIEYVLVLDLDDQTVPMYKVDNRIRVLKNNNVSAIAAINYGAYYAVGNVMVVVSDDFDCPEHWDTLLLAELEGKEDFLLKTQDGIQPILITLPILDKKYYKRFGYVYHPEYQHMHSDQEMTAVGMMLDRVITSQLVFPHNHYTVGKIKKDAINIKNDKTWKQGEALLKKRSKDNFGIKKPAIEFKDIKWK